MFLKSMKPLRIAEVTDHYEDEDTEFGVDTSGVPYTHLLTLSDDDGEVWIQTETRAGTLDILSFDGEYEMYIVPKGANVVVDGRNTSVPGKLELLPYKETVADIRSTVEEKCPEPTCPTGSPSCPCQKTDDRVKSGSVSGGAAKPSLEVMLEGLMFQVAALRNAVEHVGHKIDMRPCG